MYDETQIMLAVRLLSAHIPAERITWTWKWRHWIRIVDKYLPIGTAWYTRIFA